jgi:hypothetical protein
VYRWPAYPFEDRESKERKRKSGKEKRRIEDCEMNQKILDPAAKLVRLLLTFFAILM